MDDIIFLAVTYGPKVPKGHYDHQFPGLVNSQCLDIKTLTKFPKVCFQSSKKYHSTDETLVRPIYSFFFPLLMQQLFEKFHSVPDKILCFKPFNFLNKIRIAMTTKRTRLSSTNNRETNPSPDQKQEESLNTHGPKITKKSKKTVTSTSGSCTISFPSRKIRDLSVQNKEEAVILITPISELKALSSEDDVVMAIKHLKECDLKLGSVIEMHDTPKFEKCQSAFQALVRSIVYQQLATKAAASIYNRLVTLCEVHYFPSQVSTILFL